MSRRVMITGLGLVSPMGLNVKDNWDAVKAGRSGIARIEKFDPSQLGTHFAGEVKGFDPTVGMDPKDVKRYESFLQFAMAVATEAVNDSGLDFSIGDRSERTGVVFGSGIGGLEGIENGTKLFLDKGPRRISPFFIPSCIINMSSGLISMKYGVLGPNFGMVSACSSAGHAIADAMHIIQRDEADVMIAGGTEASITALGVAGFNAARALSTRNDDPAGASRPFSADRDGFVMSEGAGSLILEEYEHAKARGAKMYGEVLGAGMSADAYHVTAPSPDGRGAALAMKWALRSSGLRAEDIGYINAHATSTGLGDVMETTAIKTVFGDHAHRLAVSSTKSMHGHLLGAAGAIESILTILALRDQILPPTINYTVPDPECDLDYVPNAARETKGLKAALCNSFGFGGTNISLAFARI
jgi:3-oxoacyl-[acyl-carrier-protein] synthase II